MGLKNLSIRTKLIITFVLVGTAPLIISNIISYFESAKEIHDQAAERAKLVAENVASDITSYFNVETTGLIDLGANQLVIQALEEFSEPFSKEAQFTDSISKFKVELGKFYSEEFGRMYFDKTKQNFAVETLLSKLDPLTIVAQYDFIVANQNPLGKKDLLINPHRFSNYGQTHSRFHTFFRDYLNRHSLYDLFLVDSKGRIVYTVFKETDFATSLEKGPWAQTNIARAYEESKKLKSGHVHIEDFANYSPSYEAPASFASTPIYKDGKFIGSLMIQLPLDKITLVTANREGLGNKGETLLLGSDLKLRADSFRNKKTHNVAAAFDPQSKISVVSDAVKKAQSGEKGFTNNISYDGLKTLAYYIPIKVENLTWYVVAELSEEEVFEGLRRISLYTILLLVIGTLTIASVAFIFGNSMAKSLKKIVKNLDMSSQEVSSASSQSASSATELSEASTQQAASLQQTMASAEEISAMVSQNAESAGKTQKAVEINQKESEVGSKSVDAMLAAIGEIKETNEEILNQMETSNKEFGEIVKIISEIGEKTNVINEIVFQTKLLSFNASVEAARAGEHGKGFAVVAEEVGNLAQMSGNAAKEITDMLSDSIKKVNAIVEVSKNRVDQLVEVGKDKIAMGQSTAEKCRAALNKITENARSISMMIAEIAHASKEQAQGIQEINKAISQLDQVTQQNSTVAQQSSSQAEQLSAEAQSLAGSVKLLVTFVDGTLDKHDREENFQESTLLNQQTGNLIPLKKRIDKSAHVKSNHLKSKESFTPKKDSLKKVVNSAEVPSASNPNFEEF